MEGNKYFAVGNQVFKMYRTISLDITAGLNQREFYANGEVLVYHQGTADITVRLEHNGVLYDQVTLSRRNRIFMSFNRILITAPATAETIELFIGIPANVVVDSTIVTVDDPFVEYVMGLTSTPATQPYAVLLANADQQYIHTLPAGTKKFTLKARNVDVRISFVAGVVAVPTSENYRLLKAGESWKEDGLKLSSSLAFYMASPVAGAIVESISWT